MNTNTNTKHTPGPWTVKTRLGSPSVVIGGVERQRTHGTAQDQLVTVHNVDDDNGGEIAWFANAALIAAAPDLLAALEAVMADCADTETESFLSPDVGRIVRAAIAKATGIYHPTTEKTQ